jgi:uncharacterized hydrophobic protein (TIGR00271 family)
VASGVFDAQVVPVWLRTSTIKGLALIVVGFVLLLLPGVTLLTARLALGISLLLAGSVDVVHGMRTEGPARQYELTHGGTNLALGSAVLLVPTGAFRLILAAGAIYLAIRAFSLVLDAWRHAGPSRPLQLLWGTALAALALIVVLTPDYLVSSVIIATALMLVLVGGVLLAAGLTLPDGADQGLGVASVPLLLRSWAEGQDIGEERRGDLADTLYFEPPERAGKLAAWWVMLLLSASIATFGIMQDSTAVVIGAMIVAPLMIPILGLAGAIVNAWSTRLVGSLALVLAGAAAAVVLAVIIGRWAPMAIPLEANTQVTSRVSPNVLDMGVAISAGAAGAFATVNSRVASSIAGVAIAVALVPPLAVVGLTLEAGNWGDAGGAALLFGTNVVSIVLSAVLVFLVTGMASFERLERSSQRTVAYVASFVAGALLILLPLTLTSEGLVVTAARESDAQRVAAEWLAGEPNLSLERVVVSGTDVMVAISGSARPPAIGELEGDIADAFGTSVTVTVELFPSRIISRGDGGGS